LRFLVDGKDEGKGAPMACAMVYWGKKPSEFFNIFIEHGAVVPIDQLHDSVICKNKIQANLFR
jgi:hypothetical protein